MKKQLLALFLCVSLCIGLFPAAHADGDASLRYWVESSYQNIFQDAAPGVEQTIQLVMAQNEYESAQIVLKAGSGFTVQSVVFSDLVAAGGSSLSAAELKYNPIGYEYLPTITSSISNSIRGSAGYYPEWLLNESSVDVEACKAQPLWVTVHTPKNQTPGVYTGTATVNTTLGAIVVNISVEVCDVMIPDTDEAELDFYFWQANIGWYNEPRSEDQIELFYGPEYTRYSDKWWELMDKFAESGRENRNNFLTVPTVTLLFDGGTVLNADGTYTFNWSRFDQFVGFMLERGWVKRLVGNQLAYRNDGWSSDYETYLIDRDASGASIVNNVAISDEKTQRWFSQFLPALESHLASKNIGDTGKTWLDIWQQSVADEPYSSTNAGHWVTLAQYMSTYAPQIFLQEAVQTTAYNDSYAGKLDAWIMQLNILESNLSYYKNRQAAGDEVWLYTCTSPRGDYLNRFIDQPVWMGRSLMWLVYQHGLDGYLNWGWNAWHYSKPRNPYGDTYTVWPDVEHGDVTETIRLTATRDGAEEYELLRLLEQQNPVVAQLLCDQVVTNGKQYNDDPASLEALREDLIRAAAGEDIHVPVDLPLLEDFEGEDAVLCQTVSGAWAKTQLADGSHALAQTDVQGEAVLLHGYSQWDDYAVSADFAVNGWKNGDAVGVLGRYQDGNNFYHWRMGNSGGVNVLQLYKKVGGIFTKLFEVPADFDPAEKNQLKLVFAGGIIKGYLNGTLKMQLADYSLLSGGAGVRSFTSRYLVDNLCITGLEMEALSAPPQTADFSGALSGWDFLSGIWQTDTSGAVSTLTQTDISKEALGVWGHLLWSDYAVSTRIRVDRLNGDSSVGVVACYTDADNYYLWRLAQYVDGQQVLQLFSRKDGSFTKLYEQNTSGLEGSWHNLSLSVSGGTVSAYLDGRLVVERANTDHRNGLAGYRSVNGSFTVESLTVS